MAEGEPIFERSIYNLLLYGKIDCPQIIIPHKPDPKDIVQAKDLASFPPPLDALPKRTDGRPYAIFDVHEAKPSIPSSDKTNEMIHREQVFPAPDEAVEKYSSDSVFAGILVVSDANIIDTPEEYKRKLERQLQRLSQFEKLTQTADLWERRLDGSIPAEQQEPTRRLLRTYRHIAASWFTNELANEPLTRQTAKDIIDGRLPETDVVITEAREHIGRISFNLTDIFSEVDRQLHPPLQREIDPAISKLVSDVEERKRQEDPDKKRESVEEKLKQELQEKGKEIIHGHQAQRNHVFSKDEYVYDSLLDEPSQEAAAFVEELWNRTF